jgi:sterol 3beta-glucosyltransferase
LGAGLNLRKFSIENVCHGLVQLTTDSKMKERANLIGQKIRSEDGVREAINSIYRDLDFASERIKEIAKLHSKSAA